LTPDLAARIRLLQERAWRHFDQTHTPFVTLAYAQSLDGSLAATPGKPLALSGAVSLTLTHALRAAHDAILVGVGTVLADDPRLTVRLVAGADPQPIVLDSTLRTPTTARLLDHPRGVWLLTTERSCEKDRARLAARGATISVLPGDRDGRVDLTAALALLAQHGVRALMVEGGATVLSSFVAAHLVNYAVVTLAPRLVGGVHAFQHSLNGAAPQLLQVAYTQAGDDLIVWGEPQWRAEPA
jgi:3,4-dihydroxy 2-butanone 4-phosphate synthase/GTP cyclohydrolase II